MRIQLVLVAIFQLLVGCAIHPQTEDFSRSTVPDIVHQIRCETQTAITSIYGERLGVHRDNVIAFDFDFIMTESNDATSDGSILIPIYLGSLTIGWNVGAEKQRMTTQEIKFEDTFGELVDGSYCFETERANYVYPITGHIGLIDVIQNFSRVTNLRGGNIPTGFLDEIQFDTLFTSSVSPKIQLVPSPGRNITAGGKLLASRNDTHRLKLTISGPKVKVGPAKIQIVDKDGNVIIPGASSGGKGRSVNGAKGYLKQRPTRRRESISETKERLRNETDRRVLERTLEDIQRDLNVR